MAGNVALLARRSEAVIPLSIFAEQVLERLRVEHPFPPEFDLLACCSGNMLRDIGRKRPETTSE